MSIENAKIVSVDTLPSDYFRTDAKRGDAAFPASSSMLRQFLHCPARWRAGYVAPESEAKDYGSLFDCQLLTPKQFDSRFVVKPSHYQSTGMQCPACKTITDSKKCRECKTDRVEVNTEKEWSNLSDTCKQWVDVKRQAGLEVVDPADYDESGNAVARLLQDGTIARFLEDSDRQVFAAAEWHDKATGLTIPIRCLIDIVPKPESEFGRCLADVKTSRNGAIKFWSRDCFKHGYHVQAALYEAVYVAATGEDRNTYCIIGQENYSPWQPFKRIIVGDFKAIGAATFKYALDKYCRCLKSNEWPDYDCVQNSSQGWAFVSPEPWMAFEAQSDAMEATQEEATGDTRENFDQGIVP